MKPSSISAIEAEFALRQAEEEKKEPVDEATAESTTQLEAVAASE